MRGIVLCILIWSSALTVHAERTVNERVPSEHFNGKVEIDAARGDLDIVGWDKNEVEITGTIGDGVKQLDIGKGHRKVKIKAIALKEGEEREVHLVVHAPHNNDISVPFFQGPVKISGIQGDIAVETVGGNISVVGSCKRVDARAVSGNITIEAAADGFAADKVRAKTVSGVVSLTNVRREAEIKSISGPVVVIGDSFEKVSIETVSGNVRSEGGLKHSGRLQVDTHAGQVLGVFPPDFSAEFEIASFQGQVDNAFSKSSEERDQPRADGESLAEVKVTSFSGNIRLTKISKDRASTKLAEELLVNRE